MKSYEYSFDEIEEIADKENLRYDKERLEKPKPLDVYDYGEKILGLSFDWKYITPNASMEGVTFFTDGYYWVWSCCFYDKLPSKEILLNEHPPTKIMVKAKTVIIDQSILDCGSVYKEKFCAAHECGHFILHPNGFTMASCESWEPYQYGSMRKMTPQQKYERHANHFAAALLMPKAVTIATFRKFTESKVFKGMNDSDKIITAINIMADIYEVSAESMMYRLSDLK
jgi:Zn-dependent peptidase ImmA (M78 family)